MARPRVVPLPAIILVTLLVQLATPGIAWADGESPPAEAQPAVEVSSEPVPTVGEILTEAPAGTELTVVDPAGTPEPLATEQAVHALTSSDPEWCPDGSTPGGAGCTGPFGTVEELLDAIGSGSYSGNGTIYFITDYSTNDAYISGSDPRLTDLQNLGIDGQGHTLFVPLEVTGWAFGVSVTNLTVDLTPPVPPATPIPPTTALRVETTGDIQLTDVSVIDSLADGAYLDNTAGTGAISVNDSTFSDNTWTGLDARSEGDITLTAVTANGQEDGAYLDASGGSGSVTVEDSDFSNNTLAGLTAKAADGGIVIDTVTANANAGSDAYGIGLTATKGGSVLVARSGASQNGFKGVWIEGTGPINLQDVTASNNGLHGAYLHNLGACAASPITVTVDGGTFANNGGYGVLAVLGPNGAFTLAGAPVFGGNALGDYAVNLDPCPECEEEEGAEGKSYNVVYMPEAGGSPVPLDCDAYSGTLLILPNGDRAKLTCPVSGEVILSSLPGEGLPGPLPAARMFVSGASVALTKGGLPVSVLTEGGYLTIFFTIPEEWKGRSLAILYWDPLAGGGIGGWVELPAYATRPDGSPMVHRLHPAVTPDDLMYILGGVRVSGDTAKVRVSFGGTFVLVSR